MVSSAPSRPHPVSDGTGLGQEAGSKPLYARLHPQTRIYYLRGESSHGVRTFSRSNSSPSVLGRPPPAARPKRSRPSPLPLPHFRTLTSGLSEIRCPRLPGHQARRTRGVKMTQLWRAAGIKWNEGTCLRLTILRAAMLPSCTFQRKILQFVLLMYFN